MSRSLLGPAIPFVDAPSSSQINLRPPFCALVRSMGGLDRGPLRHNVCTLTLSCDALWASGAQDRASRASNHSIDAAVSKYRIDASPQHTTPTNFLPCSACRFDRRETETQPLHQSIPNRCIDTGRTRRPHTCVVLRSSRRRTSNKQQRLRHYDPAALSSQHTGPRESSCIGSVDW